jgi:hypothetical protein
LVGLTAILKEAWTTSEESIDRREKIQALSLAKDCYTTKLELLTNATVVDDAIKFVAELSNSDANSNSKNWKHNINSKSSSSDDDNNKDKVVVINEFERVIRRSNRRSNAYG